MIALSTLFVTLFTDGDVLSIIPLNCVFETLRGTLVCTDLFFHVNCVIKQLTRRTACKV